MLKNAEGKTAAWTVAGAKARLSEVMERAQAEPQTITRNGKPSVVVVSVQEWQRKTKRKGSLAEFLMNSPFAGSGIDVKRMRGKPRDLDL